MHTKNGVADQFIKDVHSQVVELMKNPEKPVEGKVCLPTLDLWEIYHKLNLFFPDGPLWSRPESTGSLVGRWHNPMLLGFHVLHSTGAPKWEEKLKPNLGFPLRCFAQFRRLFLYIFRWMLLIIFVCYRFQVLMMFVKRAARWRAIKHFCKIELYSSVFSWSRYLSERRWRDKLNEWTDFKDSAIFARIATTT